MAVVLMVTFMVGCGSNNATSQSATNEEKVANEPVKEELVKEETGQSNNTESYIKLDADGNLYEMFIDSSYPGNFLAEPGDYYAEQTVVTGYEQTDNGNPDIAAPIEDVDDEFVGSTNGIKLYQNTECFAEILQSKDIYEKYSGNADIERNDEEPVIDLAAWSYDENVSLYILEGTGYKFAVTEDGELQEIYINYEMRDRFCGTNKKSPDKIYYFFNAEYIGYRNTLPDASAEVITTETVDVPFEVFDERYISE